MLQFSRNMRLFQGWKADCDHIIADPVHITSISIQQMAAELDIADRVLFDFARSSAAPGSAR